MPERHSCIACGLVEAPGHIDMHWWDIGETAGWVCTFCHSGRAPANDPIETYRAIRRRLAGVGPQSGRGES